MMTDGGSLGKVSSYKSEVARDGKSLVRNLGRLRKWFIVNDPCVGVPNHLKGSITLLNKTKNVELFMLESSHKLDTCRLPSLVVIKITSSSSTVLPCFKNVWFCAVR